MNNRESKKILAEKHNAEYLESKKPKQITRRNKAKSKKAAQILAIAMASSGRSLSEGF